jgi:hypothetical protein
MGKRSKKKARAKRRRRLAERFDDMTMPDPLPAMLEPKDGVELTDEERYKERQIIKAMRELALKVMEEEEERE